jgi:hypothetical protein
MAAMADWRMTEPPLFGEIKEWVSSPTGMFVGSILSDSGGVYTVNSEHFCDPASVSRIVVGMRVRFTPVTQGSGTDVQTGMDIPYGAARSVSIA